MEQLLPALAKDVGAKDELKATNQMKWVGLTNACKHQDEKIINSELIYNSLALNSIGKDLYHHDGILFLCKAMSRGILIVKAQ